MSVSAIIAAQREAYRMGFLDGLEAFAWMKDGVMYVGTCGTIFADVKEKPDAIWNYNPAKAEDL